MLKIKDEVTGNLILSVEKLEGEKEYPFSFYSGDDESFYLSASECKELYFYLGEFFGPKDITNE